IGLFVLGAGSLLAYVCIWMVGKFFFPLHIAPGESAPAYVLVGVTGLFGMTFLTIGVRLLIFGGDTGKSTLPPNACALIAAAFVLLGGLVGVGFLKGDQIYFALVSVLVSWVVAGGCFVAAQIAVDTEAAAARPMDWYKTDITWLGVRNWVIRKRLTISISFL